MRKVFHRVFWAALAVAVAGCASSMSGGAYSRGEAGQMQQVQFGVVQAVREVMIEGTKSGIGTVSGAAIGGIAGSDVGGGGKSGAVGTIVGAIVGGAIGSAAEEGITRQKGYEITIKLDSGAIVAVVQGSEEKFSPGEHVQVLSSGGKTRVTHY